MDNIQKIGNSIKITRTSENIEEFELTLEQLQDQKKGIEEQLAKIEEMIKLF